MFRLGFCVSVAVSFPLVLFPCRTSIHSLIFRFAFSICILKIYNVALVVLMHFWSITFRQTYQGIGSTELVNDYIPPTRFLAQ